VARLPPSGALRKKGNAASVNLRKVVQIQYELSLVSRGRLSRAPVTDTAADATVGGGGGGGEDEAV